MKKIFFLFSTIMIIVSCKTNQLYLNVIEPAPVTIPSYIKKVGIIDRTAPTEQTKALDAADKILSLEGAKFDKEGAAASVKGLTEELKNNQRFTEVKNVEMDFRTSALAAFPVALSWEIVDKVCRESEMDALFSLERFDTDTKISYSSRKVDVKTPLGNIPALEHQADMETLVKTGWRIYDPQGRSILDEHVQGESVVFHGRGINPVLAAAALIGRKEAVLDVSNKAGHNYALRLIPYRLSVTRDYYVKGNENFKTAKRMARTGNWDGAGELWEKETENHDSKIAGRAFYNMAIINEINGNLDVALQYARKAYENYNNKLGLKYSRILEDRKYSSEVLKSQEE
jgi:tetratricopeptide (TPR) repeat protein